MVVTNAGAMNHTIRRLAAALADGYRIERELGPDRFLNEVRNGMAGVGGSGQ